METFCSICKSIALLIPRKFPDLIKRYSTRLGKGNFKTPKLQRRTRSKKENILDEFDSSIEDAKDVEDDGEVLEDNTNKERTDMK